MNRRIGEPATRRTGEPAYQHPTFNTADRHTCESAYRHIRFQRHNRTDWYTGKAAYRRSAYTGESITSKSVYQIPTFNTTETITINRRIRFQRPTLQIGTPANRRTQANRLPANRRIRFKRSTQQISTPANRRTHKRIDYRQIGVSNSNVQHNRLVHRRIGVHTNESITGKSAYQIPTFNTTETITINRRIRFQRPTQQISTPANRRTGDRRTGESANRRIGEPANQLPTVYVDKTDRRSLDQLRSIDGDRPSTPCCQR